ncbi:hypothetical protein TNIN_443711 [Trichonephila inaurata madagascariensis]|uniref:Uncharacterized protein n=1 Tax=Trichonephila inaurata madagascariensis TaxID=2747483 RepID=A0A8X6JHH6_9ARAC|nr:hypothetical protein TNIN_443711 [Trichonephila inaurata madagascariensis]
MDKFQVGVRKASRKLVEIVHPGLGVSKGALKALQVLIFGLNQEIVEIILKNGKKKKPQTLREDSAQKAVEQVLPGTLKKCALAEAHKCLAKFGAGLIKYKPQITHVKKKKSKSLDAPREFMKCVPNLLQLIDTHARIDMDAKLMIGDILNQMCKQVVAKTHELALANKTAILGSQDVISAVYACMGPNLAKHAIAEGARNALLFINNTTKYKAEDFAFRVQRQELRQDPAVGNIIGEITEQQNNNK